MCGICGWITKETSIPISWRLNQIEELNKTLIHRGPDEQNIWVSEDTSCLFGHTRLIVVDQNPFINYYSKTMTSLTKHDISKYQL